jgi:multicomponent K+:H+ antiporter subunit G
MVSHFTDVPLWVAIPVSVLIVLGALLTLLGTIGLVRLSSFYARIHAPTLGTSWGAAGIVLASMLLFSATGERPVLHEILLGVFVTVTTPVTLMLLGRAALYRDDDREEAAPPADPQA